MFMSVKSVQTINVCVTKERDTNKNRCEKYHSSFLSANLRNLKNSIHYNMQHVFTNRVVKYSKNSNKFLFFSFSSSQNIHAGNIEKENCNFV